MQFLTQPWILGRLALSALATLGFVTAAVLAFRIGRSFSTERDDEAQLRAERLGALLSPLLVLSSATSLLAALLTVVGADQLASSIPGAMCAYGVFDSTTVGFTPVLTSALAALLAVHWLAVHAVEGKLERLDVFPRKLKLAYLLAPVAITDSIVYLRFASQLDFEVRVSCCSLSTGGPARAELATGGSAGQWMVAATALLVLALFLSRRATRLQSSSIYPLAGIAIGAVAVTAVAMTEYVAPHVFETPLHHCPFCLLHADVFGYGYIVWPLLLSALAGSTVPGFLQVSIGRITSVEERRNVSTLALRSGAVSFALVLILVWLPVLVYRWRTGADVFGSGGLW